jgi:hypothetical protein
MVQFPVLQHGRKIQARNSSSPTLVHCTQRGKMLIIWCLQITRRLEVGTNCSSLYKIFPCHYTHMNDTKMATKYIVQLMVSSQHIKLISGLDQSVNTEKLVKATRTINVTLHFLPLISQHTAGAIVSSLSSVQETTNKLQHDHDRYNQN